MGIEEASNSRQLVNNHSTLRSKNNAFKWHTYKHTGSSKVDHSVTWCSTCGPGVNWKIKKNYVSITLTKVLLLFNHRSESGYKQWFLVSHSCMSAIHPNHGSAKKRSISFSQINVIPEHNPDSDYITLINLFAVDMSCL